MPRLESSPGAAEPTIAMISIIPFLAAALGGTATLASTPSDLSSTVNRQATTAGVVSVSKMDAPLKPMQNIPPPADQRDPRNPTEPDPPGPSMLPADNPHIPIPMDPARVHDASPRLVTSQTDDERPTSPVAGPSWSLQGLPVNGGLLPSGEQTTDGQPGPATMSTYMDYHDQQPTTAHAQSHADDYNGQDCPPGLYPRPQWDWASESVVYRCSDGKDAYDSDPTTAAPAHLVCPPGYNLYSEWNEASASFQYRCFPAGYQPASSSATPSQETLTEEKAFQVRTSSSVTLTDPPYATQHTTENPVLVTSASSLPSTEQVTNTFFTSVSSTLAPTSPQQKPSQTSPAEEMTSPAVTSPTDSRKPLTQAQTSSPAPSLPSQPAHAVRRKQPKRPKIAAKKVTSSQATSPPPETTPEWTTTTMSKSPPPPTVTSRITNTEPQPTTQTKPTPEPRTEQPKPTTTQRPITTPKPTTQKPTARTIRFLEYTDPGRPKVNLPSISIDASGQSKCCSWVCLLRLIVVNTCRDRCRNTAGLVNNYVASLYRAAIFRQGDCKSDKGAAFCIVLATYLSRACRWSQRGSGAFKSVPVRLRRAVEEDNRRLHILEKLLEEKR